MAEYTLFVGLFFIGLFFIGMAVPIVRWMVRLVRLAKGTP